MTGRPEHFEAAVIGGGVVGCALLRELAKQGIEAVLLEAEPSVGEGTSKANSAIVHTGFDAHPGTVEATMLRRAAALWPEVVEALGVPYLSVGALMLARDADEAARLRSEVAMNAATVGVPTEWIDAQELRRRAPYVTNAAVAALAIPDEAIIDPFWLTRAYAAAALEAGAGIVTDARVADLTVEEGGVTVGLAGGRAVRADQVFDAAGLWADEVAAFAGDRSFTLTPRRGQFLVSEEAAGVDRIVLPLPGRMGKGMLVTPIVFGGLLLGPTAEEGTDKGDRATDGAARARILAACTSLVPAVTSLTPIRQFCGLRAVSSTGDYILRPSSVSDRLYLVTGIRSTGISTSPAVAEHVVREAAALRGWGRPARTATASLTAGFDEPAGAVVCPCRWVSAGEIRSSARRIPRATTLDAAKRACGTTFGDCQGNRCAVATAQILAAAAGQPVPSVMKHRAGSWLFREGGPAPSFEPTAGSATTADLDPDHTWDVVVIGGGLAGIGAALAAAARGLRPLVVERRARWGGELGTGNSRATPAEAAAWVSFEQALTDRRVIGWIEATVAGLTIEASTWSVDIQTDAGVTTVRASNVVLACGGYIQPREHLAIAGPRGSGIATGDLVDAALDAGLLPGLVGLVVGNGRYADTMAGRMTAVGMRVHRATEPPDEVRGDRRLEAVRCGADWLEVDLLVLADRFVPAPFLLRPLGLIDSRVGTPAPTDDSGRCPLPGLWAAGTCRVPDIDHRDALADGWRVGSALTVAVQA